jgi:dCMP deaminase
MEVQRLNKWDHRFMEMARLVASWSSCFQPSRAIGAVIVKDKRVMTTGYNGAPAGVRTCKERGECMRRRLDIPSGTRTELCYAIHAEQNAVVQAAKLGVSIDGGTCYCTHQPCSVCARILANAGIRRIVFEQGYPDDFALQILNEAGVVLERWEQPAAEEMP